MMLAFITPAAKIEASKCSCPVTFRDIPLSHQFLPFFASQMLLLLKMANKKTTNKIPTSVHHFNIASAKVLELRNCKASKVACFWEGKKSIEFANSVGCAFRFSKRSKKVVSFLQSKRSLSFQAVANAQHDDLGICNAKAAKGSKPQASRTPAVHIDLGQVS